MRVLHAALRNARLVLLNLASFLSARSGCLSSCSLSVIHSKLLLRGFKLWRCRSLRKSSICFWRYHLSSCLRVIICWFMILIGHGIQIVCMSHWHLLRQRGLRQRRRQNHWIWARSFLLWRTLNYLQLLKWSLASALSAFLLVARIIECRIWAICNRTIYRMSEAIVVSGCLFLIHIFDKDLTLVPWANLYLDIQRLLRK